MSVIDRSFEKYRAVVVGFDAEEMPRLSWMKIPLVQVSMGGEFPHRYCSLVPDILYATRGVAKKLKERKVRSFIDLKEINAISKYCQRFLLTDVIADNVFDQCGLNTVWVSLLLTRVWKIQHDIYSIAPNPDTQSIVIRSEHVHPEALKLERDWTFHYVVRLQAATHDFFMIDPALKYPMEYREWISSCFQKPVSFTVGQLMDPAIELCGDPSDHEGFAQLCNRLTTTFDSKSGQRILNPVTPDQPFLADSVDYAL